MLCKKILLQNLAGTFEFQYFRERLRFLYKKVLDKRMIVTKKLETTIFEIALKVNRTIFMKNSNGGFESFLSKIKNLKNLNFRNRIFWRNFQHNYS